MGERLQENPQNDIFCKCFMFFLCHNKNFYHYNPSVHTAHSSEQLGRNLFSNLEWYLRKKLFSLNFPAGEANNPKKNYKRISYPFGMRTKSYGKGQQHIKRYMFPSLIDKREDMYNKECPSSFL